MIDSAFMRVCESYGEIERAPRLLRNNSVIVGRLPNELWLQIFDHGRTDGNFLRHITWTCSHWRKLARGCSSLWTNIKLVNQIPQTIPLYWLSEHLQLSKHHQLSFDFTFFVPLVPSIENVAETISPHLYRCRDLAVNLHSSETFNLFFPLEEPLPALRRLHITIGRNGWENEDIEDTLRVVGDDSTCNIEYLDLDLGNNATPIDLTNINPTSVKYFRLNCMEVNIRAVEDFISRCTNLKRLSLDYPRLTGDVLPAGHFVSQPLISLITYATEDLIQRMDCPSLLHFHYMPTRVHEILTLVEPLSDTTSTALFSTIARFPLLRSVIISGVGLVRMQPEAYYPVYENLAGIELPCDDPVLDWLNQGVVRGCFPRLRIVLLRACPEVAVDAPKLADILINLACIGSIQLWLPRRAFTKSLSVTSEAPIRVERFKRQAHVHASYYGPVLIDLLEEYGELKDLDLEDIDALKGHKHFHSAFD